MKLTLLAALLLFPFAAPAADWGKATWGMSRAQLTAQYPTAVPEGDSLKVTKAGEILDVPVDATFDFRDDKLTAIILHSDDAAAAKAHISPHSICDLLMGKYGAPLNLKPGPPTLEGIWHSDRSVIKYLAAATPSANTPFFSIYYWDIKSPRYDEI